LRLHLFYFRTDRRRAVYRRRRR